MTIGVKAAEAVRLHLRISPHGIVVATDRQRDQAFVVRWSGTEPGAASELAALGIDRARTWEDVPSGARALEDAGAPVSCTPTWMEISECRPPRSFRAAAAASGADGITLDDLPHVFNPSTGPRGSRAARRRRRRGDARLVRVRSRARRSPTQRGGDSTSVRCRRRLVTIDPCGIASLRPTGTVRARLPRPVKSGWAGSPHFRDLAANWSAGEAIPLAFSDAAVAASAETTLTLVPRR